jgi:hypothetical protein
MPNVKYQVPYVKTDIKLTDSKGKDIDIRPLVDHFNDIISKINMALRDIDGKVNK